MTDDLSALQADTDAALAAATDLRAWDAVRVGVLGKSGRLTLLLKELGRLSPEERRARGAVLNEVKQRLEAAIEARRTALETAALDARLAAERLDVTAPPRPAPAGLIHPISRTMEEMAAIFGAMGFSVGEGLDIQTDWFNFSALNIPAHHPARADHDTFYLPGQRDGHPLLLRTQTSDVQIISMLNQEPPLRVIAPGRTYRADHDATHSPMFHQCEGIAIDRGITLAHLKGCLIDFLRAFFGIASLPVRFRSSYFPFTEPSMEVDIGWNRRTGELGGGGDWLEILGSGMVHPKVLANCGIDPREWQGFAFGMGVERVTMLKHGIPDLRPFYDSDIRWLRHYGTSPLVPTMLHEGCEVKFTLSWLRTHLDTDAALDRITDTLTAIGLELEAVEDRGAALAPFRIAHVIEAVPHPNADRLRACRVDTGEGVVSVVCGAPNARTGMKAVFAPPGAHIPGTGITLKVGEIRGVQSAGMLLSAREMGLDDDHAGIVELPDEAPIGARYAAWAGLDDPVIEIGVTPNRGDALSVRGVARDLAAAGIGRLRPWHVDRVPAAGRSRLHWRTDWPDACPWILGRSISGLRNGPSQKWLADRLLSVGLRPINALVDVTNFFTLDLGRPLHVFDADRVTGDVLTLRRGAGESLLALNGKQYEAAGEDCVIADAAGVQSLAGVIGGEATGCSAATTAVFVECALFDPVRVALTGRRHQIVSDARQRFERGIDPAFLPDAIEAATRLILDLCGGEASDIVSAGAEPAWRRRATLRFSRLAGLGGVEIAPDAAVAALQGLGFAAVARDAEAVTVDVPSWRNDVAGLSALDPAASLEPAAAAAAAEGRQLIEPEADLVEEVLRLHGLDRIAPVSMPPLAAVPRASLSPRQSRAALARRVLAAAGLAECVTFSFMAGAQAALFGGGDPALTLSNPIAADLDQMRPTPLATLALAAARNAARGYPDVGLFEIGPAFVGTDAAQQAHVAVALRAGHTPRHWAAPARPVDAMDARADALAVLAALGVPGEALSTTADAPGFYHPGRSGVIRQGPKTVLASFGELHPRVLATLDLTGPAVAMQVFLAAIPEPKRRRRAAPELPAFQPVRRDFAFLVAHDVPAETLLRAARGADRALVAGVVLFDAYAGEKVPEGQKSLGIEVIFQTREATLTDLEIEAACDRVVAAVGKATGAVLR